jgi:hypothetical protein
MSDPFVDSLGFMSASDAGLVSGNPIPWAAMAGQLLGGIVGQPGGAAYSASNPIIQPYARFNVQPIGINFGNVLYNEGQPTSTGGLGLRFDRLFTSNDGAGMNTADPSIFDTGGMGGNSNLIYILGGLAVGAVAFMILK